MVSASIVLTTMSAMIALGLLWGRPSNIGSIVSGLSVVFAMVPGLLFYAFGIEQFYSFRSIIAAGGYVYNPRLAEPTLLLMSLFTFVFCIGTALGLRRPSPPREADHILPSPRRVRAVQLAGLVLWVVLLAVYLMSSGADLTYAFLPSARPDLPGQSGYLYTLVMTIPFILMITEAINPKRRRIRVLFFALLGILACLTTHQRREIVTLLLIVTGILAFLPSLRRPDRLFWQPEMSRRMQRNVVLVGLAIGLATVPLAWYLRNWSASLVEGRDVNVFEIRSMLELLMGSPSTAFPTFVVIYDYVAKFGAQPGTFFLQLFSTPIPRAWWPDKPGDIDAVLQTTYGLSENPSTFWMGEFYFNYGVFGVFASGVAGYLLTRIHLSSATSGNLYYRAIAVLIFAYSITMFKNGLYLSVNRFGVAVVVLYLAARYMKITPRYLHGERFRRRP